MTTDGLLTAQGVELMAQGRFQEALAPLHWAIALGDKTPSTMLNLAIALERGAGTGKGLRHAHSVAVRVPDWDDPWLQLAEHLRAAGETLEAEDAYHHVLALNPDRPEALIAMGGLMLMRGSTKQACDVLAHGCGVASNNAEAWNTLGLALQASGAPHVALSAFTTAHRLQPDRLEYLFNARNVAGAAGAGDSERDRLLSACRQNPININCLLAYGILLDRLGHRPEALDVLEAATELTPDELVPLQLLGSVLARSSRTRQAEEVLRRVRVLDPDNPQVNNDHAAILMRLHRHGEARAILLEGIASHGPHLAVLCNLANATVCVGLQDEAVEIAREAIELDPHGVMAPRVLCNTLPYRDGTTAAELLTALKACSSALPRVAPSLLRNTLDPTRPLVVGLLSGTLRSHPVGWLTVAGIEGLDPARFNVICLAQNVAPEDPIARRYRAAAREWVDIDGIDDIALLELARSRRIDILIDLGGYGDAARMPACANRLAPVQIKWVGMQSHSSGLAEMDWFLTDRWETPDGSEPLYSERLLRMPDGYVCYTPPSHAPDVVALPALARRHVTFGCFNNLAKITPQTIETWAQILKRVPTARLILKTHQLTDPPTVNRLTATFCALGIDCARIELRGSSGHRAFLGEYGDVDMVLDPFPYSGGLTTCEALWMGVPTITLPGEIFASRHSASHLSNAGLSDWLAGSVDEYVELAVARASNVRALASLRTGMRESVRRSPLCDAPRFGRNLGAALRRAWQDWCDCERPSDKEGQRLRRDSNVKGVLTRRGDASSWDSALVKATRTYP